MPKKVNIQTSTIDIHSIEHLVCNVGALWRRLLNTKIKSLGLCGTETRALMCIARNPGLTQIQIANLLDLEPQNLMRSLDKLENQGWIQKQSDTSDRRIKCISITNSAKKIIAKIQSFSDSTRPHVLSGIEAKNLQLLTHHLATMRENIIQQLDMAENEEE